MTKFLNVDENILLLRKKHYYLYILIMMIAIHSLYKKNKVSSAIVSRCHHEGDFTVSCDNKSKLSPLLVSPTDTPEYMRYAKVINGLYHNDTLCSFVPNTSCYRKQILSECEDKQSCKVKNGWFSLEPDCDGNSYYTQLEYDCQPAFYMCDKETIINNVFSGMIYSPSYPNSFRKDDKSEPCYLTIHLPKNHHAEITLDHFDLLKTAKCIGDYIEIQQYKEVSSRNSGDLDGSDYLKVFKHKRNTGDISQLFFNNKNLTDTKTILKIKKSRQQRKPKYKWQTLGTMCGRIDNAFTIRATADTINFKFRPLSANHPYLQTLSANQKYKPSDHAGFKIYFQAIPPKAPSNDFSEDIDDNLNYKKSDLLSTTSMNPSAQSNEIDEEDSELDKAAKDSSKFKMPLWLILILISIGLLIIAACVVGIIFFILKRRKNEPKSLNTKTANSIQDAKSTTNLQPKTSSIKTTTNNNTLNPGNNNKLLKKSLPNVDLDSQDSVSPFKNSTSTFGKPDTSITPQPSGQVGQGSKKKVVLMEEPRKMQAERPALLQDLSQSKLLLKFKQEHTNSESGPISTNNTETLTSPIKQPSPKDTKEIPTSEDFKSSKKNSLTSNSISSKNKPKQIDLSKNLNTSNDTSGVYGAEPIVFDGGGVYGADPTNITKSTPTPSIMSIKSSIKNQTNSTSQSNTGSQSNSNSSKRKESSNHKQSTEKNLNEKFQVNETTCLINENLSNDSNSILISNENEVEAAITSYKLVPKKKSSLIMEHHIGISESLNQQHNTTDNSIINTKLETVPLVQTEPLVTEIPLGATNAQRKPTFNPLYVILKDKNKYHTTEYI